MEQQTVTNSAVIHGLCGMSFQSAMHCSLRLAPTMINHLTSFRIAACSKRCTLRKGGAHTRALRGSLGRYYNINEVGEVGCRN